MATQRQIEANRRNRKLWQGHTPAGLATLRRAVLRNKPWLRSTGPRTNAGKTRSKMNAWRHGERSAAVIERRRALNEVLRAVRDLTPGLPS